MRASRLLPLCFCICVLSRTAVAQYKVGDRVIVVRDCEIKIENVVSDRAYPGLYLWVTAINGKWLWVTQGLAGWIDSNNVTSVEQAIPHFTEDIRQNPTAKAFSTRGMVWYGNNDFDNAIADFSEAIRLNPAASEHYGRRGNCWSMKREWDRAIADWNEACRLKEKPSHIDYYCRGRAFKGNGEYERAIADYDAALRLEPRFVKPYASSAWLRATCQDSNYRDGQKAVRNAMFACKGNSWKSAADLDTLAAAYAEIGDFAEAVKWEEKALEIGGASEAIRSRLELFRSGKPFRDDERGPTHK